MDDLVVLMDESHRYRAPASLKAINHLKPVLGIEFTATPKYQKNVVYSFGLAEAIGRFVKTPTVITRTNLTLSDAEEIERLKLRDGLLRHEMKKGRLREYCEANSLPLVKPFVLISTKDTAHAKQVREAIEQEGFMEGRYRGKVIEIHSAQSGAESDENVRRLLAVEHATSGVEVVIHVNMLKEGWDVNNLYTIIPLRASTSEILTEQTIGRGLRLPFGRPTGDHELDALEIISHDQYAKLIAAAKDSPLFHVRQLEEADFRPMETVPVTHRFVDLDRVLDRLAERQGFLLTAHLSDEDKLARVVGDLAAEELARHRVMSERVATGDGSGEAGAGKVGPAQEALFPVVAAPQVVPVPFDPEVFRRELTAKLRDYAAAAIDVPDIITETSTERRFEAFPVRVTAGPFSLVECCLPH
jgi:type III restriction enzyme